MLEKREFEKNDFMWRVSAMCAFVMGFFSLIVFILLIINYLQIRAADPVDNPMLTEMRIEYANAEMKDEALARRIQELDLLTRKAFFTTQNHLRVGGILLLIGCSIFMIAFKNMARWRPERPKLADKPTAEVEFLALAESRNLIMWAAVIMLGGGLAASYLTESALVPGAGAAVTSTDAGEAAEAVPTKEFPGWDAMAKEWPSFRGAGAMAIAQYENIPTEWDLEAGTNIKWKVDVPRVGTNSPVIWGNRLFMSGADEETREVYCYDTETGELIWTQTLEPFENTPTEPPMIDDHTGYAPSTMVVHGDQVFALFVNGDLVSYDFEGNLVWGYNFGLADNHYGHSSSLIAYDNLLYMQWDQAENSEIVALNAENGEEVWATPRDEISWASPVLAQTEFGPQLILASEEHLDAYNPATGELLWREQVLGGEVAPSPAYSNGIVFAANEYAQGGAVKLAAGEDGIVTEILWEYDYYLPEVSSPVGDGERFYFATSGGEIVALDANNGEELWIGEAEDGFYSSPVLVGDRVYVADMSGNMYVFKTSSEYELINQFSLGASTYATPAFLDGRVYVRTTEHLYCVEAPDGE